MNRREQIEDALSNLLVQVYRDLGPAGSCGYTGDCEVEIKALAAAIVGPPEFEAAVQAAAADAQRRIDKRGDI